MELHDEHKRLKNETGAALKAADKKLQLKIAELKATDLLHQRTKAFFFSVVRPRLTDIDPIRYSNRVNLQKDLMTLAAVFKHNIPPERTDLKEALLKALALS